MRRIIAAFGVLLLAGCGGTGPSDPPHPLPLLGEYQVEMEGQRTNGTTWQRHFRVRLELATQDSLVLVVTGGDLPTGMRRSAGLIDYVPHSEQYWHTIFGVYRGNVVLVWWPDGHCDGRLLVDLGESHPARTCYIGRL